LNVKKSSLLTKQTQVQAEKSVGQACKWRKTARNKRNAASSICWQSVQDQCRILFENSRCA